LKLDQSAEAAPQESESPVRVQPPHRTSGHFLASPIVTQSPTTLTTTDVPDLPAVSPFTTKASQSSFVSRPPSIKKRASECPPASPMYKMAGLDVMDFSHEVTVSFLGTDYLVNKIDRACRSGELGSYFSSIISFDSGVCAAEDLGPAEAAAVLVQAVWRASKARRKNGPLFQTELDERKERKVRDEEQEQARIELAEEQDSTARWICERRETVDRADKVIWEAEERLRMFGKLRIGLLKVEVEYRERWEAAEYISFQLLSQEAWGRWQLEKDQIEWRWETRKSSKVRNSEAAAREKIQKEEREGRRIIVKTQPRALRSELDLQLD